MSDARHYAKIFRKGLRVAMTLFGEDRRTR